MIGLFSVKKNISIYRYKAQKYRSARSKISLNNR